MTDITLQLYSARNTELQLALRTISEAGYQSVEAYGANFENQEAFATGLKSNGLKLVSSHVGIDQLEKNLGDSIELLSSFGASHIVCPYLVPEERPVNKDGWLRFADSLSVINERLISNGFTFAWHNHDFEFNALPDKTLPMNIILDHAPGIHWEIDIGWVVRAGLNPQEWLQSYAKRISAVHFKDVAKNGEAGDGIQSEDGWADVGHGIIDWANLLSDIKQSAAKHFIVEHDNPSDFARFAQNSISAMNTWGV